MIHSLYADNKSMKRKLWFILAFCLLCFSLVTQPLFVGAISERNQNRSIQQAKTSKNKSNKKQSTQKTPGLRFDALDLGQRQRPEQATGIILSFHKWPSEEEQSKISKKLKKEGLKLTKKFQSFKALVFSWKKLKTQNRAKNVCRKLSQLKDLNYCEPDALLHPNNTSDLSASQTEAGSPSCTDDCIHPQTPDQKAISEIQSIIQVTVPKESCELLPTEHQLKDGKLTDYWAQEMIGADLLREEIEKTPPLPEDKFLVAVFDSRIYDHGIYVQNLISHEGEQAVLPGLNTSQIQFFETEGSSQYMDVVEKLQNSTNRQNRGNTENSIESAVESMSKQLPSFINNSMNWKESQTIYEAMSKIHPPAILVKAAGNDYPWSLDPIDSQFSKNFDSILVGSLSPSGVVSDFSQEGEEVHILAPADRWLTSINSDGSYVKFGGTSGAAPLVTGSLASFEQLSGYHPTPAEAKLLLEQTAIPTIHSAFENPRRNGVGMLNAYKLGMVAKRLKEKCKKNDHCFKMEILNLKNYEFPIDKEDILEQTNKTFPQCSDEDQVQAISCADKKSAFKKLRQAVLLDIENISLLEKLHCVYTQEGFSENALNVEATIAAVTRSEDQLLKLSYRSKIEAVKIAQRVRSKVVTERLKDLALDPDEGLRQQIAIAAGLIGGTENLKLLKDLALDPDASVRNGVALGAGHIGGTEGSRLLKDLALDPDNNVMMGVAIGAGAIGGEEGSEILQVLFPDPNERGSVAHFAQEIGNLAGLKILRVLELDPDPEIRSLATETIQEFLD